jgi:hypothetical protein
MSAASNACQLLVTEVDSFLCICVLIVLYVSSCCYLCVLMLLYMCPHAAGALGAADGGRD